MFVKRCGKLVEMLSTIGQFEELAKNKHIDGMDHIRWFFKVCGRSSSWWEPYDLLDYQHNQLDYDFEFNVMGTTSRPCCRILSINPSRTSPAWRRRSAWLTQFQRSPHQGRACAAGPGRHKYNAIFRNYSADLEAVQNIYEKQKQSAIAT